MPYVIHIVEEIFGFSIRIYFRFNLNVTFSHPGILNQGLIFCNAPSPNQAREVFGNVGALSGYPMTVGESVALRDAKWPEMHKAVSLMKN